MLRGRLLLLPGAAALLALPVPIAAAAPTRAEYVAQVDPVCATYTAQVQAAGRKGDKALRHGHLRTARRNLLSIGDVIRAEVAAIATVPQPAGDEAILGQWLGAGITVASINDRLVKALFQDKQRKFNRLLDRQEKVDGQAEQLVAGFGFQSC